MSGVTRDYSSPSLTGRRLGERNTSAPVGAGRRHTAQAGVGSQLLKQALAQAAIRSKDDAEPIQRRGAPAHAPVRREAPPSRFATMKRRADSPGSAASSVRSDSDSSDDETENHEDDSRLGDEEKESVPENMVVDVNSDDEALIDSEDEDRVLDAAASMDSVTSEPKPIRSSRDNISDQHGLGAGSANSTEQPDPPTALSNLGHVRGHSRTGSMSSIRARLTPEEKNELMQMQKKLSELLARARLVVPKVRVVNEHIDVAKMLLVQAVDKLEKSVEDYKSMKASPEHQTWRKTDELIATDKHATHDDVHPAEAAESASKIEPSAQLVAHLMDMETTVTSDYDSPRLGSRSIKNKARDKSRSATVDSNTMDAFRKAALQRQAMKALQGSAAKSTALGDIDNVQSGRLLGTPQNKTRALTTSAKLVRVASSDKLPESDPMHTRVITKAISIKGTGVTSDFDSPRLTARSIKRSSAGITSAQGSSQDMANAASEAVARAAKRASADLSPVRKKGKASNAMAMLQNMTKDAPHSSPVPVTQYTASALAQFAAADLQDDADRQAAARRDRERTPKPEFLRKIDTSVFSSPARKTKEQEELEALIERAEMCLSYVGELEPETVRATQDLLNSAVSRLEQYAAMLK